jgi:hypothetical protein
MVSRGGCIESNEQGRVVVQCYVSDNVKEQNIKPTIFFELGTNFVVTLNEKMKRRVQYCVCTYGNIRAYTTYD